MEKAVEWVGTVIVTGIIAGALLLAALGTTVGIVYTEVQKAKYATEVQKAKYAAEKCKCVREESK